MLKFPCLLFRENKIVHSREELIDRLNEANQVGKSCEVGFYAFTTWENMTPMIDSIIIDKVIYKGSQATLEKLAEKKLKEGVQSILIFDGERFLLFTEEPQDSLANLMKIKEPGVEVVLDVDKKFVFPGYRNLKSGQMSKIIKKWKIE